jgi:hypothetical protein
MAASDAEEDTVRGELIDAGRPKIDRDFRDLIRRMGQENLCGERRGYTASC